MRARLASIGSSRLATSSSRADRSPPQLTVTASCARTSSARAWSAASQRCGFRDGEQLLCRLGVARLDLGLRPGKRAPRPLRRVGRQQGRPLKERGGGSHAAPRLRPAGRPLKLTGDVLVGAFGGFRPVPGAAVGIKRRVRRVGEGGVRLLPFPGGRRPVDGRAGERVTEAHPRAELHQPRHDRGPGGPGRRSRAAPPRATGAPGRRSARPPRAAAGACSRPADASTRRRNISSALPGTVTAPGRPNPPAS